MVLGPNDEPHRFCQKCHLVHPVSAFAGSSHICVAKLAQLKERRAARRGVPPAAAAPAAGGSRDEQVFLFGEAPNWQESLLQTQQAVPDASTAAMVTLLLASPPLVAPAPPSASPSALALHTLQRAESPTGWPVSLPECLSVEVKLPAGGSPAAVLPASGMRDELLSALSLTLVGDASTSQPASAALFMGAVRPGCTLLTLDASLLSPPAADGGSDSDAVALRETQAINGSLSALGDVMQALACKRDHVPYRFPAACTYRPLPPRAGCNFVSGTAS